MKSVVTIYVEGESKAMKSVVTNIGYVQKKLLHCYFKTLTLCDDFS